MKHSRFTAPNRNFKALLLIGFLFLGNASFAQTTQIEHVKATKTNTELSEYPTDPVIVPADLKKYSIEQSTLVATIPIITPVVTKKRIGFVGVPNPRF